MYNVPTEPSRAIAVCTSDQTNVPYPNSVLSGTTTAIEVNALVDSTKNFLSLGIKVGDTVYNATGVALARVVDINSTGTKLFLDQDIFTAAAQNYVVYQGVNPGGMIYVSYGGDVRVLTADNDVVFFPNIQDAMILPVRVLRVFATGTTATNLISFW